MSQEACVEEQGALCNLMLYQGHLVCELELELSMATGEIHIAAKTVDQQFVTAAARLILTATYVVPHSCRQSYNVAPGAYMPVLRYDNEDGNRNVVVQGMRWGLVPSFTRKEEKPDFFRMFNARSESVGQKASFRRLLPRNRCLVAVEGFYEWKKHGPKKQPYYVHFKDGQPLLFAALYDKWKDEEGTEMHTFTILTTRCSKSFEWLHDRMPVILGSQDAVDVWLGDELLTQEDLDKLTQPYEGPNLVWIPVTPAIGKLSFSGPECIEPVKLKSRTDKDISQMFGAKKQSGGLVGDVDGTSGEEEKAVLAAMEPDQDVTEALTERHDSGDRRLEGARSSDPNLETIPSSYLAAPLEGKVGVLEGHSQKPVEDFQNRKRRTELKSPKSKKFKSPVSSEKQKTLFSFFGKT